MSFFLYVICDDAPLSPNHYSRYSALFYSWTSPHNVAPIVSLSTSLSFYFPFFFQQSTAPWHLFHIYCITHWSREFLHSYCCFYFHFYCCPPNSLMLCGLIFHYFYILPWITCHYCFYFNFIRCSMLEPSLMIHPFPLFFLRSVMPSRINISLS